MHTKDPAEMKTADGTVPIIQLSGSWQEMGEEFGLYCLQNAPDSLLLQKYLKDLVRRLIKSSKASRLVRFNSKLISSFLYMVFHLLNRPTGALKQFQEGFASTAGVSTHDALYLIHFPDIMHILTGKTRRGSMAGCSGFFVRNELVHNKGSLLGRNFDFFGPGKWDRFQALKVFHPQNGNSFFWLGPLGIPVGGFGGNRQGLLVMPFTNFSRQTCWRGEPVFSIMQHLLAHCTTIEEARSYIDKARVNGGISLLIADMKNKKATAVGLTGFEKEMLIPEADRLIRTNHYITLPLQKGEVLPTRWHRNSHKRWQRIDNLINISQPLSIEKVVNILSDRIDPHSNEKTFGGDIIAAINNATSVLVDWGNDALYLSTGRFPVSSTSDYCGFRYSSLFDKPEQLPVIENPNRFTDSQQKAMTHYIKAWSRLFEESDINSADRHFQKALDIIEHEPLLILFAAVSKIRLNDYSTAEQHLNRLLEQPRRHHWHWEGTLWKARLLDLQNRREEAVSWYKLLIEEGSGKIHKLALNGIKRSFRKKNVNSIIVDCITGSTI